MPNRPPSSARFYLGAFVLAVGLAGILRWQDVSALQPARSEPLATPTPSLWPGMQDRSASVMAEVKAMKLVTAEVRTNVTSTSSDVSMFGDVSATVTAPVRLLYGCDLASLETTAVTFSPLHDVYLLRVRPPERIAAEIQTPFEKAEVKTGWMRSRATDGEYHLGEARRDLMLRAQELAPDAEQRIRLREDARSQIAALVRKIVGDRAGVKVTFTDEFGLAGSGK
jgi:hypothetical protein